MTTKTSKLAKNGKKNGSPGASGLAEEVRESAKAVPKADRALSTSDDEPNAKDSHGHN